VGIDLQTKLSSRKKLAPPGQLINFVDFEDWKKLKDLCIKFFASSLSTFISTAVEAVSAKETMVFKLCRETNYEFQWVSLVFLKTYINIFIHFYC